MEPELSPGGEEALGAGWVCGTCTLVNSNQSFLCCELCGAPREAKPGSPVSSGSGRMVEALYVFGIPAVGQPPATLIQHPAASQRIPDSAVLIPFAAPSAGWAASTVGRSPSGSGLDRLLYSGPGLHSGFVFSLSHSPAQGGAPERLYGCCLPVDRLIGWDERSPAGPAGPWRSARPVKAPRVLCVLSSWPWLQLHFGMLTRLLERLRLLSLESFPPAEWRPAGRGPCWRCDMQHPSGDSHNKLVREAIADCFERYCQLAPPRPGQSVSWDSGGPAGELLFRAPRPALAALADWAGSPAILRLLGPERLCQLYNQLLRERSVLLICQDKCVLSRACLTLLQLISPLHWEGLLLTVTPEHLSPVVDAPVPFIAGLQQPPPARLQPREMPDTAAPTLELRLNLETGRIAISAAQPLAGPLVRLRAGLAEALEAEDERQLLSSVFGLFRSCTQELVGRVGAGELDGANGLYRELAQSQMLAGIDSVGLVVAAGEEAGFNISLEAPT